MNSIVRMIRETDLSSGFVYNYLQEREERESDDRNTEQQLDITRRWV